jgi:hypothetical protein
MYLLLCLLCFFISFCKTVSSNSVVVTSQSIVFPLVPDGICNVYENTDSLVTLAVNVDDVTAELPACTEVGFAADFFSYFITAEADADSSTSSSSALPELIEEIPDNAWSWRHFESVPSAHLLNSQYQQHQNQFHQTTTDSSGEDNSGGGGDGGGSLSAAEEEEEGEEEEGVRLFSSRWKTRSWPVSVPLSASASASVSSSASASISVSSSAIQHNAKHTRLTDKNKMPRDKHNGQRRDRDRNRDRDRDRGGDRANICLLFGGEMDGMKSKVHQLMESFSADLFRWSYWSDVAEKSAATQRVIRDLARRDNVRIFESVFGLSVQPGEVSDAPTTPREHLFLLENNTSMYLLGPHDSFEEYRASREGSWGGHVAYRVQDVACEYMFLRLVMARFSTDSAVLAPPWVARAWRSAVEMFSAAPPHPPCDALMFGNDKSALSLLLVGVARLLGIPR